MNCPFPSCMCSCEATHKLCTAQHTITEFGEMADLSIVKLPPQIKGKIEFQST